MTCGDREQPRFRIGRRNRTTKNDGGSLTTTLSSATCVQVTSEFAPRSRETDFKTKGSRKARWLKKQNVSQIEKFHQSHHSRAVVHGRNFSLVVVSQAPRALAGSTASSVRPRLFSLASPLPRQTPSRRFARTRVPDRLRRSSPVRARPRGACPRRASAPRGGARLGRSESRLATVRSARGRPRPPGRDVARRRRRAGRRGGVFVGR